jgi:hypothetical protein
MGYRVITGAKICKWVVVCEYLGRLLPLDWVKMHDQVHSHSFRLEYAGVVDACEYGNVGECSFSVF